MRRTGETVPPPSGVALINGISGERTFHFDKCTDWALVAGVLAAMDLPADYAWQWRSGSHKGYGASVVCDDDLPPHIAALMTGGILIGTPRDGADFKQLELRY